MFVVKINIGMFSEWFEEVSYVIVCMRFKQYHSLHNKESSKSRSYTQAVKASEEMLEMFFKGKYLIVIKLLEWKMYGEGKLLQSWPKCLTNFVYLDHLSLLNTTKGHEKVLSQISR